MFGSVDGRVESSDLVESRKVDFRCKNSTTVYTVGA